MVQQTSGFWFLLFTGFGFVGLTPETDLETLVWSWAQQRFSFSKWGNKMLFIRPNTRWSRRQVRETGAGQNLSEPTRLWSDLLSGTTVTLSIRILSQDLHLLSCGWSNYQTNMIIVIVHLIPSFMLLFSFIVHKQPGCVILSCVRKTEAPKDARGVLKSSCTV